MAESVTPLSQQAAQLVPFDIIRTETVLSKLPIHNLAKRGRIDIRIKTKNEHGELILKWEVSYNEKSGQARQLAYKVDTLVVNRRIDELGRPLPKIVKLGGLGEIATELGLSPSDTATIKQAIKQNVGVQIDAKLSYNGRDGRKRKLETTFHRYSVVFTGEEFPDGTRADAVYLVLDQSYWEVLNNAPDRPLDYAYLKALSPSAQRFYEIVSYRMFAALKYGQPRARIAYSEYCVYSAQAHYFDYKLFKSQMFKIHKPHRDAGYIAKVSYEATIDTEGKPDWLLFYTPGPKALAEYETFRKKEKPLSEEPAIHGPGEAVAPQLLGEDSSDKEAFALVRYFYERFHDVSDSSPSPRELQHASELITQYGIHQARYVVDFALKAAPETNFQPQTFGGILHYTARALADFQQQRHSRQQAQAKAQQHQHEERQLHEERERRAQLAQRYQSLPPEEQARLQEQAKTNLLQRGYKPETMFGAVVNSEIYRLMDTQEGNDS